MSGQLAARPPNAPPAATPGLGIQPGTQRVVIANYVIIFGPSGTPVGVFVYAPGTTPGPGNSPVESMSEASADPYGNVVLPGNVSYFVTGGVHYALVSHEGQVAFYSAPAASGPWTQQADISLYDPSNIGGITIAGTAVRIAATANSSLILVNGVNSWQEEQLLSYVAVNEQINTQTNLTQDVYLSFSTLQPSAVYDVQGLFIFDAASGVNFKWSYAIGGTGDRFHGAHIYNSTGGTFGPATDLYTASASNVHAAQTTAAGTIHSIWLSGTYETAAAAGSPGVFGLMWAQNTSSANNLTLHDGSKLTLRRIA